MYDGGLARTCNEQRTTNEQAGEGGEREGEERFVERWNENTCEREKVREREEEEEEERERERER